MSQPAFDFGDDELDVVRRRALAGEGEEVEVHRAAGVGDLAQHLAADLDQRIDVVSVIDARHLLVEEGGDLFLGFVDGRHDDVRGLLAGQLDDVLAHVRFQRADAGRFGGVVELDFLADHRLALDHQLRRMALADTKDDGVGFVRRFRPMDLDAIARQVFFHLQQQFRQLAEVVLANMLAQRAQAFQFFRVEELADALVDQEIHRAAETLAQERVVDHRLGPGAEAFRGHEIHRVLAHAASPISKTINSFGPCAP